MERYPRLGVGTVADDERHAREKKTVYLPADLDERLRRSAQKHRRSFNSELVWAIQRYLEQQEQEQHDAMVKKPCSCSQIP